MPMDAEAADILRRSRQKRAEGPPGSASSGNVDGKMHEDIV
jgi:hypothetical protein